ncbi:MAG: hypothetical protein AAGI92_04000 [Pseudomonadota bacterium]
MVLNFISIGPILCMIIVAIGVIRSQRRVSLRVVFWALALLFLMSLSASLLVDFSEQSDPYILTVSNLPGEGLSAIPTMEWDLKTIALLPVVFGLLLLAVNSIRVLEELRLSRSRTSIAILFLSFGAILTLTAPTGHQTFLGWQTITYGGYALLAWASARIAAPTSARLFLVINVIGDFLLLSVLLMAGGEMFPFALTQTVFVIAVLLKSGQFIFLSWALATGTSSFGGMIALGCLVVLLAIPQSVMMIAQSDLLLSPIVAVLGPFGLLTAVLAGGIACAAIDPRRLLMAQAVVLVGLSLAASAIIAPVFATVFAAVSALIMAGCIHLIGEVVTKVGGEKDIRKYGGLRATVPLAFQTILGLSFLQCLCVGVAVAFIGAATMSGASQPTLTLAAAFIFAVAAGGLFVSSQTRFISAVFFGRTKVPSDTLGRIRPSRFQPVFAVAVVTIAGFALFLSANLSASDWNSIEIDEVIVPFSVFLAVALLSASATLYRRRQTADGEKNALLAGIKTAFQRELMLVEFLTEKPGVLLNTLPEALGSTTAASNGKAFQETWNRDSARERAERFFNQLQHPAVYWQMSAVLVTLIVAGGAVALGS